MSPPPTHNREPYDTLDSITTNGPIRHTCGLSSFGSCSYIRSVCGTDAPPRSNRSTSRSKAVRYVNRSVCGARAPRPPCGSRGASASLHPPQLTTHNRDPYDNCFPPTHKREPYDTLLYCPTSCPYRSVCGTDAACRLFPPWSDRRNGFFAHCSTTERAAKHRRRPTP